MCRFKFKCVCLINKSQQNSKNEKSYINSSRFKNEEFDAKYEAALNEKDKTKRYQLFKECDQILINEGALLNIYYHENDRLN